MALSVWFNGCCECCPCQSLTVLVLHAKRCYLFDCMFHGQSDTLEFGTYQASLFLYRIKFVYQICIKSISVVKLQ